MNCGLDFGSSNCALAIPHNDDVKLLPIDGESSVMPTLIGGIRNDVFAHHRLEKISFHEEYTQAKKRNKKGGEREEEYEEKMKKIAGEAVARKRIEMQVAEKKATDKYNAQTIFDLGEGQLFFGKSAKDKYDEYSSDMLLLGSAKPFLGAKLDHNHKKSLSRQVYLILKQMKHSAEKSSVAPLTNVVIGIPVNFGTTEAISNNEQAVAIIRESAYKAGFENVRFVLEPVAAAIDFERQLNAEKNVLVVDLGGGTTDVVMMKLSPDYINIQDRYEHILASAGMRIGGNDIDRMIINYSIMPHLGRNYSDIKYHVFADAAKINDINAQNRFFQSATDIKRKMMQCNGNVHIQLMRLYDLCVSRDTRFLSFFAESLKIALSKEERAEDIISRLGDPFKVTMTRDELLEKHSTGVVNRVRELIDEVINASGVKPDHIYVTGGTSNSLILLRKIFTEDELEIMTYGTPSTSVVRGLAMYSDLIFR